MSDISIFTKDVQRPINGVITADDDASLKLELEEYVLTREAEDKLSDFLESYNSGSVNGAWISGHFGSGKSHLLKMLAVVLDNRVVDGQNAADIFLPKCEHNTMLHSALQKAVSIPSRNILFNIAQMAPSDRARGDAVLDVFMKVFNKSCGYNYQYAGVANLERGLDCDGKLAEFKERFEAKTGKSWDAFGASHSLIVSKSIDEVYNEIYDSDIKGIIKEKKDSGKFSAEDFGMMVADEIKRDGRPGFRINFFVDEVGQFVANNTQLMLSLQTIAETLNTKCKGQAWITVTSQVDLSNIVGNMDRTHGNDFSRIEARFAVKMLLSGKNAKEVIQKRLVDKTPDAIASLVPVWTAHENDFKTLYEFVDGSKKYAMFSGEEEFVNFYPFAIYQFDLFHTAMAALSSNEAFTGRYTSVGERSMLSVCQLAVIKLMNAGFSPGKVVPFDYWFEGIRNSIQPIQINQISVAENHRSQIRDSEFAIRILKALFLVKYVREFKSTIRNICVLLLDDLNMNMLDFCKRIEACLADLENQSYVQHVGEVYEYLTDEEKSIDKEIKDVEVSPDKITALYAQYAFSFSPNKKIGERGFDAFIDDNLQGRRTNPLGINVITHMNPLNGRHAELVSKTLVNDQLVIDIPPDADLTREMLQYERTKKYLQQHPPASETDGARKRLLEARSKSNGDLETRIQNLLKSLLGRATIYFAGEEMKPQSADGRTNIENAFGRLVTRTFSQYSLIEPFAASTENDLPKFLKTAATLPGFPAGEATAAENAVFAYVQQNHYQGRRVTMDLVVKNFEAKPYGWRIGAIDCVVARLFASGRLEFSLAGSNLDERGLAGNLGNTRRQGEIIIKPTKSVSPQQLNDLADFAGEFFNCPFSGKTAKELTAEVKARFAELEKDVALMVSKTEEYPFTENLRRFSDCLSEIMRNAGNGDYFFEPEFESQKDCLFDERERFYDPILKMMNGEGLAVYSHAQRIVRDNSANIESLQLQDAKKLSDILASRDAYTNQSVMQMRTYTESLQKTLLESVVSARNNAIKALDGHVEALRASAEYGNATDAARERADAQIDATREAIAGQNVISLFNQKLTDFTTVAYPAIIAALTDKGGAGGGPQTGKTETVRAISDTVRSEIAKMTLSNKEDVDAYLASLRARLESEIANGTKIIL